MHILCIVCVNAQLLSHSWFFVTAWTSPPGSSVHGIFWARILEWIATSYSRGSSWPRGQTQVTCVSGIGGWILCHCTTWEAIFCADMHTYMINKYRYIPHTYTHACFLASHNWYWLIKHSKSTSLGKIIKHNELSRIF